MNCGARDFVALRRVVIFPFLLLSVLLQGCVTQLQYQSDVDRLTERVGLGHLYYIGTQGEFNYLATKYFMERTKYYRVTTNVYPVQHTFPKTKDRSKWVPYLHNLGTNTEGFRDEPNPAGMVQEKALVLSQFLDESKNVDVIFLNENSAVRGQIRQFIKQRVELLDASNVQVGTDYVFDQKTKQRGVLILFRTAQNSDLLSRYKKAYNIKDDRVDRTVVMRITNAQHSTYSAIYFLVPTNAGIEIYKFFKRYVD